MLVVDASVALEWLLDDAAGSQADAIIRRCLHDVAFVPPLFWLEVANTLRTRLKRGDIDTAFQTASLRRLRIVGLQIDLDSNLAGAALDRVVELSDRYDLTVYDAVYLELTLRLGADLATFDRPLATAAKRAGAGVVSA
jgi:predicted nucleic acid-binding protein